MSQSNTSKHDLDSLTANHRLKMMKAALPYMGASQQKAISVLVKAQELQNTLQLAMKADEGMVGICSADNTSTSTLDMLHAIKPYATPYEQDFIDVICNFMQGFRLYNSYQASGAYESSGQSSSFLANPQGAIGYIEQLKKIMPKEQTEKWNQIEMLFTLMQQLSHSSSESTRVS